jgi:hypothetical protein
MSASQEAARRFFAERVASEALAKGQGHLPFTREGLAASAAWYQTDDELHILVEAGGEERAVDLKLEGDGQAAAIAAAVEKAVTELSA